MKLRIPRSATVTVVAAATALAGLAVVPSASAATVTSVRTLSSATLNPGQSRSLAWNNANSDMYQVTVAGVRADNPDLSCMVEVTKQWYRLAAGGSRQFVFTYRNVDGVACRTTPYLAAINADRSGSTGVINPGSSRSWQWNNANVNNLVYVAGATPSSPESGRCDLEVTSKNRARPDGEQEFVWTVRNNGTVACSGQWRLGWLSVDERTPFPSDDLPDEPGVQRSLNSPLAGPFRVYVFNPTPRPTGDGNCEWAPTFRKMSGDPSVPTADARTDIGYANAGSVACVLGGVSWAYID